MIEGAPGFLHNFKRSIATFPNYVYCFAEFAMRILDYVIEVYAILYFHV